MKLNTKPYEERMQKSITAYENNLAVIRAGQANTAILSRVSFEYYGSMTPINTMADIRVADAKTVTITPYDASTLKAMEKAILASDVGITPTNDGKMIRLVFPQPTEERRKELVKQVKGIGENARISLRNARRDAVEAFKKAQKEGMPEDESKDGETRAQKLLEKFSKQLDALMEAKEKEIMTV